MKMSLAVFFCLLPEMLISITGIPTESKGDWCTENYDMILKTEILKAETAPVLPGIFIFLCNTAAGSSPFPF